LNPGEDRRERAIRARLAMGFWYAILLSAFAVVFGLSSGMPVAAVACLVLGTFGSALLGLWIASKLLRRNPRR
jgi:threonine/homoserine/homoserine lactone efflux protein